MVGVYNFDGAHERYKQASVLDIREHFASGRTNSRVDKHGEAVG